MAFEIHPYDREAAVAYAHEWAYRRNPKYLDFENIGGDCTNFASQCLYAGSGVQNYTPVYGWYYISPSRRSASWTGVQYFYNFLTGNQGVGPFGREVSIDNVEPGDFVSAGDSPGTISPYAGHCRGRRTAGAAKHSGCGSLLRRGQPAAEHL